MHANRDSLHCLPTITILCWEIGALKSIHKMLWLMDVRDIQMKQKWERFKILVMNVNILWENRYQKECKSTSAKIGWKDHENEKIMDGSKMREGYV